MEELQVDLNHQLNTKVSEVNSLGSQISQLNKQIYRSELDGNSANDLRDQRTVLIDKLSSLINIDVNEVIAGKLPNGKEDRKMVITISGKPFVDHFDFTKLAVVQRDDKLNPDEDVVNLYDVMWEDGNSIAIRGGEIRGLLDVRDGNDGENQSPAYKGIPFYIKKLNEFVRTFAKAFDEGQIGEENLEGHMDGYGAENSTGIRFFTMLGEGNKPIESGDFAGYDAMTAKNFSVSWDVIDDIALIAASGEEGQIGNIENLNKLIKMRNNNHMFMEGEPEDFMKSIVSCLGIDSQQAIRMSANQQAMIRQVENQRLSESGVSMDEEMANMVKHYQAYNAAATMINTMSEIYDILINRVGI